MAGPAGLLREIHRLLSHARDLDNSLESGPRRLKAQQQAVARAEEELRQAQDAIKMLKVGVHDRESSVKGSQQQIKKYEQQLSDITSKKEYEALKLEVAHAKEKIKGLEDEALNALLEIDEKTGALPALEAKLKKAKAEFADFERDFQSKVAMWTAERAKTLAQIAEEEKKLPGDIRTMYDRLVRVMGADAIAVVDPPHCTACYTELTVQLLHNLQLNQFVVCRSCARMLYVLHPAGEPVA